MLSRKYNWNYVGTDVKEATCFREVLVKADLDFQVATCPLFFPTKGESSPKMNKVTTGKVVLRNSPEGIQEFGLCGNDFTVIQNETSLLIAEKFAELGAKYSRAGSIKKGSSNFIMLEFPKSEVLQEPFLNRVIVHNSHLPGQAFRVQAWFERLICSNGLTALVNNTDLIRVAHTKQVNKDNMLYQAQKASLKLSERFEALQYKAEQLAKIKLNQGQWQAIVDKLLPFTEESSRRIVGEQRSHLFRNIFAQDLANHVQLRQGELTANGWGAIQAVADYTSHFQAAKLSITPERLVPKLLSLGTKDDLLLQAQGLIMSVN